MYARILFCIFIYFYICYRSGSSELIFFYLLSIMFLECEYVSGVRDHASGMRAFFGNVNMLPEWRHRSVASPVGVRTCFCNASMLPEYEHVS